MTHLKFIVCCSHTLTVLTKLSVEIEIMYNHLPLQLILKIIRRINPYLKFVSFKIKKDTMDTS